MERIVKGIWFPIEIWEAEDLTWNEKVLLMEIDSYTARGKDCFISDEYIAELLKVSVRSAATMVSNLIQKGYIKKTRFDGRKRYIESTIAEQLCKFCRADMQILQNTNIQLLNEEDKSSSINSKGKFDFRKALIGLGVTEEVADAWLMVRKAKRATNSKIAFEKVEREIAKTGRSADDCIRIAVENSWQGFAAEWLERPAFRNQGNKTNFQHSMEVADLLFGTNLSHKS